MAKGIKTVLKQRMSGYDIAEPIFICDLIEDMPEYKTNVNYHIQKMIAAGEVAKYQAGIYYKTHGKRHVEINQSQLIVRKFLRKKNGERIGYLTGHSLFYEWGFSKHISHDIWIAQNKRCFPAHGMDVDPELIEYKVKLLSAKGVIRDDNVQALKFLDILYMNEIVQDRSLESILELLKAMYYHKFTEYLRLQVKREIKNYPIRVHELFSYVIHDEVMSR